MKSQLVLSFVLVAATAVANAQSAAAMTRYVPAAEPDGAVSAPARHAWFKKKSAVPDKAASGSSACPEKKDER